MTFVVDTFTEADGTNLASHTAETGAPWTKHGSCAPEGTANPTCYHASGVPVADAYDVEVVVHGINQEAG